MERNKKYTDFQRENMIAGLLPSDQWRDRVERACCNNCNHEFSKLGRKLVAIDDWENDDSKTSSDTTTLLL